MALGEPFLGFLAIVALGLTLFPMLFAVTPAVDAAIEAGQWAIIAWFSVELVVAFACAADKRQFLANPWRWLDLATILLALGSLLPSARPRCARRRSCGSRASAGWSRSACAPAVFRHASGRVQAAAAKFARPGAGDAPGRAAAARGRAARASTICGVGSRRPTSSGFTSPAQRRTSCSESVRRPACLTGFSSSICSARTIRTGRRPGLGRAFSSGCRRLDATGHLDRFAILLVPTGRGLLSLSRRALPGLIAVASAPPDDDERPFTERMIGRVLERVVRDYQHLAGRCEDRLRELEDVPVHESRPAFFELTFRMKKQLSAAQSDLWRLKRIADDLVARRGAGAAAVAVYARFESDIDYLYDTMINIREGVLSVIDLHLNVVSFEMNRVMRVLAVISALGLIPAIVGGLLGMNLIDTPWMLTLPQVAFGVFFGMVIGLYFFLIKGWLR